MDVAGGRRGRLRSWHALTFIGSAASSILHHHYHHRRRHIVTLCRSCPSTAPPPSGRAAAADDDDDDGSEENIPVTNRSFWTKKIHLLCSRPEPSGGVDEALRLLDRLRLRGYRPDSLNLSSVVHGLCAAGRSLEAHRRLLLSVASGWVPDDRTSNVLVARLLDARSPDATRRVVDCLVAAKPGFVLSSASCNRLIDQFCSQPRLADARGIFLDMKTRGHRPDVVSYTALIGGFGRAGQLDSAQQLFDEMTMAGVPPNSLTYSALIRGVLRARRIECAREMVGELWTRMEREEDPRINNAAFANLVDAFSREGYFREVFWLAEEMPQGKCVDEDFAYGQMIDSLCRVGRHHGASRVVYIMRKRGFTPSLVSYNCIVHGLSKEGEGGCMRAYQLFKEGVDQLKYSPPESTYKSLVEGLCRARDVPKAQDVTEFVLRKEGVDRTRIYNMFLNALRLAGGDPGSMRP
ncbi:hypothetical protein Taro_024173 [Colocasia esculenta]|uniref:Pentatricopeptide repeat-containing protein n=1 Tax=Colocasia esculenta TaxID=4460 RepID=A0A843VDQ6_COLES|nr:hypothetical protein [Colocasia esculenta]